MNWLFRSREGVLIVVQKWFQSWDLIFWFYKVDLMVTSLLYLQKYSKLVKHSIKIHYHRTINHNTYYATRRTFSHPLHFEVNITSLSFDEGNLSDCYFILNKSISELYFGKLETKRNWNLIGMQRSEKLFSLCRGYKTDKKFASANIAELGSYIFFVYKQITYIWTLYDDGWLMS